MFRLRHFLAILSFLVRCRMVFLCPPTLEVTDTLGTQFLISYPILIRPWCSTSQRLRRFFYSTTRRVGRLGFICNGLVPFSLELEA